MDTDWCRSKQDYFGYKNSLSTKMLKLCRIALIFIHFQGRFLEGHVYLYFHRMFPYKYVLLNSTHKV